VIRVDYEAKILTIIHFDGPSPDGGISVKAKVVEANKPYSEWENNLYKVIYGERECLNRGK